ncbi:MAG: hypothetical protein AWU57_1431 [Marinobacter sp. T13-3]|nr:MAG: hypothetical protein AWU57_1431 [Marinobacter sp. T13-3]
MQTKITTDGKNLFVPIPAVIVSQAGFEAGQLVELTVSEGAICLNEAPEDLRDSDLERLVALVHSEALELFEGDARAKYRWLSLPQESLGGRKPSEMLGSEEGIDAVRLLICRLEHGSVP